MNEIYYPLAPILDKLSALEKSHAEIIKRLDLLQNGEPVPEIGGIDLAMSITGYKRQTLYELVSRRQIPFIKKSGRLFFSRHDLMKWLNEGRNETINELAKDLSENIQLGKL